MRTWLKWAGITLAAVVVLAVVVGFLRESEPVATLALSDLVDLARDGDIVRIEVDGGDAIATTADGERFKAHAAGTDVAQVLASNGVSLGRGGVELAYEEEGNVEAWFSLILYAASVVVFSIVIYYAVRRGIVAGLRAADERETPQASAR